jgi:hypothetical protein
MKRTAPDTCNGFSVARRTVEGLQSLEREEKCAWHVHLCYTF